MSSLSTHVLDTERGEPAAGLTVTLFRGEHILTNARTDANGRIADLANELEPGTYRLGFDIRGYLNAGGSGAPFLQSVEIEFRVDADAHYHVPLLMTPYACTSYRGS